jgi:predicted lipoprotein
MSERSLSNIRINIEAAQRLYHGETAGLDRLLRQAGEDELAARISAQFERIEQQLAPLGDSLLRALEQDYDALGAVATELKTLNSLLNEAMLALNVQLGFNSRDGD